MLQEFFKSTIYSKAIKYLLSQTPLPMYKTITSNEFIYKGNTYVYKNHIIECIESGIFIGVNAIKYVDQELFVSNDLTVSDKPDYIERRVLIQDDNGNDIPTYKFIPDYLRVTDSFIRMNYRPLAKFKLISNYIFGTTIPGVTQTFISNTDYYDPKTHKWLGEYLRCLKDIKGIDLMSMYNCFEYKFVNNLKFTDDKVISIASSDSRVTLIPIKFNKEYSIAIDCDYPIRATAVLYKDRLIVDDINKTIGNYIKLDSFDDYKFSDNIHVFNNISFAKPVVYKIKQQSAEVLQFEKYLYLAIELPKSNDSSIVVLEGNYTDIPDRSLAAVEHINNLPDYCIAKIFRSTPKLLEVNDKKQHPFSDKLLQYLLCNTIDSREVINQNIEKIEEKINYSPKYNGNWSNVLRYILYNKYMSTNKNRELDRFDVLGFVDRDMEQAIERGLIKYE